MRTNRISHALQRLDAEKRAVLELCFSRVVPDEEIADLLRVDPHDVRRRRQEGMEELCLELRISGAGEKRDLAERLRSMPEEAWRPGPAAAGPAVADSAEADPAVVEGADGDGSGPPRRRRRALLAAVAVVGSAAVIAAILSSGDDDGSAGQRKADAGPFRKSVRAGGGSSAGHRAALTAVGGSPGQGTAQIVRDRSRRRLRLRVRGLRPPARGEYVVWLYDAIGDSRSIGGSQRRSFTLDAPLPSDASRFRFIDISLEPPDGIRAHGGDSVLRVPIARLGEAP